MKTYRFLELVEKEKGFEFYQAFRYAGSIC